MSAAAARVLRPVTGFKPPSRLTVVRTMKIADPTFLRVRAALCDEVPVTRDGVQLFDLDQVAALVTLTVESRRRGQRFPVFRSVRCPGCPIDAHSAGDACRKAAVNEGGGVFMAIPERSAKPVTIRVETVQQVIVETDAGKPAGRGEQDAVDSEA